MLEGGDRVLNAVTNYNFTPVESTGSNSGQEIMGQDDFLKMLMAQLQNQDPLSPMDSTDFSAQLAQFSSVEQLQGINDSLEAFIDTNVLLSTSINNTLAANVIGRNIKAMGNSFYYDGENNSRVNFTLGGYAQEVVVEIYDAEGNLVRTIDAEGMAQGDNYMEWDGRDENGNLLSKGVYSIKVSATDVTGNPVYAESFISGEVTGIRYDQSGAVLVLGELTVNFGDVTEIFNNS